MAPKVKILRDRKYLDSFNGQACWVCAVQDGTIVPAHIRHGFSGGMGLRPPDNLTLPLCHMCHALQHAIGEVAFWQEAGGGSSTVEDFIESAILRYARWRDGQCH